MQETQSRNNSDPDDQENDLFRVEVRLPDRVALGRLLSDGSLDFGSIQALFSGEILVDLFVSQGQVSRLRESGWNLQVFENFSANGRERQNEVGKGDRFEGGKTVPKGLGKKYQGES